MDMVLSAMPVRCAARTHANSLPERSRSNKTCQAINLGDWTGEDAAAEVFEAEQVSPEIGSRRYRQKNCGLWTGDWGLIARMWIGVADTLRIEDWIDDSLPIDIRK
jgi:hypothetical protein